MVPLENEQSEIKVLDHHRCRKERPQNSHIFYILNTSISQHEAPNEMLSFISNELVENWFRLVAVKSRHCHPAGQRYLWTGFGVLHLILFWPFCPDSLMDSQSSSLQGRPWSRFSRPQGRYCTQCLFPLCSQLRWRELRDCAWECQNSSKQTTSGGAGDAKEKLLRGAPTTHESDNFQDLSQRFLCQRLLNVFPLVRDSKVLKIRSDRNCKS